MTLPGSLNRLLLLCGVTKALKVTVFQRLISRGWLAFNKGKNTEKAHEALRCGRNVVVMVADSDLQSECQRWLQVANYCNATSIALHSLTQPIPEVLQKFRQHPDSEEKGSEVFSQFFGWEDQGDLEPLWEHLGYSQKVGQRQTHRTYAPATQEPPNLWLNTKEAELALAGIRPRDYMKYPEGCQEWPQAKKLLKQAQGVAKSEAKRLHALDKQNRQKILDKSSKAEQPPAAKQEKGGKHKEPKNTAKQKQKRRFAELFDQIEAEDYQYSPPQTSTGNQLLRSQTRLQPQLEAQLSQAFSENLIMRSPLKPTRCCFSGSSTARRAELKKKTRDQHEPRFLEPIVPFDQQLGNSKPVLLFDLNGTLTSHTHQRRSTGLSLIRPGIHHLRRLQDRFNLGIFSSASSKTVNVAREMLELAAGPGRPLFPKDILILHRVHTISASVDHKLNGGKDWDTMKPLHCYFSRIHQTLLVDDDAFKACEGEERNMILMPRWEEEPYDNCIEGFVETLLSATDGLDENTDLRESTRLISLCLGRADNS